MRTFKYALLIAISLICVTPKVSAEDPSTQDIAALEQKAQQGDVAAQYNLGAIYQYGNKTIPQDKVKANEYYKQACLNKSQDGCDAYKRLNNE